MSGTYTTMLIRADASSKIGYGHVMRCLALAAAWLLRDGQVIFLVSRDSRPLEKRILQAGCQIEYLPEGTVIGSDEDAGITGGRAALLQAKVVLDGYSFTGRYQTRVRESCCLLLVLDDYRHSDYYCTDILLNQNVSADISMYPELEMDTKLLLGTRYCLLRKEFAEYRFRRIVDDNVRSILLTMGGSDPANNTLKLLKILENICVDKMEVKVVLGGGNLFRTEVEKYLASSCLHGEVLVDVENMPGLMASCDLAISAAGSTAWELSYMGLPAAYVIIAENQRALAESLSAAECGINLGWDISLDERAAGERIRELLKNRSWRESVSARQLKLVDGMGGCRVAAAMCRNDIILRQARLEDVDWLFDLANDPLVRENSFHQEDIPYEQHREWFLERLKNPDCCFFIGETREGVRIGQIRFDIEDCYAVAGVSTLPEWRGKGYGRQLIEEGAELVFSKTQINHIKAYIKSTNYSSQLAFKGAGFDMDSSIFSMDENVLCFRKSRTN